MVAICSSISTIKSLGATTFTPLPLTAQVEVKGVSSKGCRSALERTSPLHSDLYDFPQCVALSVDAAATGDAAVADEALGLLEGIVSPKKRKKFCFLCDLKRKREGRKEGRKREEKKKERIRYQLMFMLIFVHVILLGAAWMKMLQSPRNSP